MNGTLRFSTALTACLLTASVQAGPITATRDGWITLPEFDALEDIIWTADVGTPYFLFHDPVSNHDSTWNEEQFFSIVNTLDGRIYIHLRASSLAPRCGRWQADVGNPEVDGKSLGIESWNCGSGNPPQNEPPFFPSEPPVFPPNEPFPPEEPSMSAPEPSTFVLLVIGAVLWIARRQSR